MKTVQLYGLIDGILVMEFPVLRIFLFQCGGIVFFQLIKIGEIISMVTGKYFIGALAIQEHYCSFVLCLPENFVLYIDARTAERFVLVIPDLFEVPEK